MVANKEVPEMSVAECWLESAEKIYMGEDEAKMMDRAMRVKGDVDRVVIDLFMLKELRAIRAALETNNKDRVAAKGKR